MSDYPTVKVAAVQTAPVFMNLDATVDKTCRLIDEAATQGAKVIGFPGLAIADVDLNAIISGKFCTDPTGHYSTPGFLSLTFDQREHVPVKKIGEQTDHHISYEQIQTEQ